MGDQGDTTGKAPANDEGASEDVDSSVWTGEGDPPGDRGQQEAQKPNQSLASRFKTVVAELKATDWLMVVLTAVIAGSTVWNTIFVGGQLAEMHASGTDTHNLVVATQNLVSAYGHQADETQKLRKATDDFAAAMKRQADNTGDLVGQTKTSASAAQTSARAAQGQLLEMKHEQRAVVSVASADLTQTRQGKIPEWAITVSLQNTGSTPTKNLVVYSNPVLIKTAKNGIVIGEPVDPLWSNPPDPAGLIKSGRARRLSLGPHASAPIGNVTMDAVDFQNAFSRTNGYGAYYGIAFYDSDIPRTPPHVLKFCFSFMPGNALNGVILPAKHACLHWNCADEECKTDKAQYEAEVADEKKRQPPD